MQDWHPFELVELQVKHPVEQAEDIVNIFTLANLILRKILCVAG